MIDNLVKKRCCDDWAHAHRDETDNEGYSSLISYDENGEPEFNRNCDTIKFCPWCGEAK